LLGQVSADATSVELSADAPDSVVTITNGLPGPTDLRIDPHVETIKGLVVKLDKTRLEQGEKGRFISTSRATGKISDIVEIVAIAPEPAAGYYRSDEVISSRGGR